jgi:polyphosphate kinase
MRSHRERILHDLDVYLSDNTQAWCLDHAGTYRRQEPGHGPAVCSQESLLDEYAAGSGFSL